MILQTAFKEWAVICAALAQGQQSLILRKGGVAEDFTLEHTRFWLYPTFIHQQEQGIRAEARPLLDQVLAERPPENVVHLSHFAEVTGVYHVHDLLPAHMIAHLHFWSDDTVEKRFNYRTPGLHVFATRIYRAAGSHDIGETDAQRGCKSWVHLDEPLPTEPATPVLSDKEYQDIVMSLDLLLRPTAYT